MITCISEKSMDFLYIVAWILQLLFLPIHECLDLDYGNTYLVNIFSARQHAERAICYRPSVCPSVRLSVCPSVCHTGGSVKNG